MILEPGPDFNQPFEYDMSGLLLVSDPPDFKSVRVEEVVPGSAGDEAGIRVKDELMALDGKAITQYSMDQLKELFRQPGREYKLTIRREGRESDVLLKTRRMI
jgi:C-terminal processing protease CtpA/Prc